MELNLDKKIQILHDEEYNKSKASVFNNKMEAFAVLLKSLNYIQEDVEDLGYKAQVMWEDIKEDMDYGFMLITAAEIRNNAKVVAEYAIQLSVDCDKMMDMFARMEENDE